MDIASWFKERFLVGVLPCRGRARAARRRAEALGWSGSPWREANRRSLPFRAAKIRSIEEARTKRPGDAS